MESATFEENQTAAQSAADVLLQHQMKSGKYFIGIVIVCTEHGMAMRVCRPGLRNQPADPETILAILNEAAGTMLQQENGAHEFIPSRVADRDKN